MPEGFQTLKLECGHTHVHYSQKKTDECAIACAAMVIAMKRARYVPTAQLRQGSQDEGGLYYRPSASDIGAKVGNSAHSDMAMIMRQGIKGHTGGDAGTGVINLKGVLKGFNVESTRHFANVPDAIANAGMAIAFVSWDAGGAHFIVIHGSHNGHYCILDPGTNHKVIRTCEVGALTYSPSPGSTGRFTDCLVIT